MRRAELLPAAMLIKEMRYHQLSAEVTLDLMAPHIDSIRFGGPTIVNQFLLSAGSQVQVCNMLAC